VHDVPLGAAPIEAVAAGLEAIASGFEPRREFARRRQAIINASSELRERELIKLASLAAALAAALRDRGVEEPAASLTAEAGIAVFKIAFERWVEAADGPELAEFIRESFEQLTALTAATS
jgi:hypothetical protein